MIIFKQKVLETNAEILVTPLCSFTVEDSNGGIIPFNILDNQTKEPTVYIDNSADNIQPVEFFDGRVIRIPTEKLDLKSDYYIRTSVQLEWRDSDEYLFTYGISTDTETLAVSFPDPNDDIKMLKHDVYTEDDLKWYDIIPENGSYKLRLLDRDEMYVHIPVFWIWNITDHMDDYESAAEVATW